MPQLLNNQTPVTVELVSNRATRRGQVVLAIPLLENFSWFLGVEFDTPGNLWGSKSRQQTGLPERRKRSDAERLLAPIDPEPASDRAITPSISPECLLRDFPRKL